MGGTIGTTGKVGKALDGAKEIGPGVIDSDLVCENDGFVGMRKRRIETKAAREFPRPPGLAKVGHGFKLFRLFLSSGL
jgi:hypothetical protein